MRCKMCGAELKKEGDICKNCYDKYIEQETLKLDNEQEIYRVKRKYSPKFNLLKNGELIVFEIIIILAALSYYMVPIAILVIALCVIVFGAWMFFNKRRAMGTQTIFYETKLKYQAKYLFVNHEEIVPYNEIKDMPIFKHVRKKYAK